MVDGGGARPRSLWSRGAGRGLALAIGASVAASRHVSAPAAHRLAVVGGTVEWAAKPGLRRRLRANLAPARFAALYEDLPRHQRRDVRRDVRVAVVNEARRSADIVWALGAREEMVAATTVEGLGPVHEAITHGRGAIFVGLHFGGWEVISGLPQALFAAPATAIVVDDWMARGIEGARVRAGMNVIYRSEPMTRALGRLRAGQLLFVLGDGGWGPEPRTVPVRLLGLEARVPAGICVLARISQAPVVGFTAHFVAPRRWRVVLDPPLDPPARDRGAEGEAALMQQLADRWTDIIRAEPAWWAARFEMRWRRPDVPLTLETA